ncbi:MAG: hypothetical protein E7420_00670 [Ruminococcaceae bacterium]|nr:hypothetical protein [Oscillospiraceae bacterium]
MKEITVIYIECARCGKAVERTAPNQKYCPNCSRARKRPAGKKRKSPSERLCDHRDLRGKSLARVDAEAKAFGLSYGQYTAAVYSGGIDALLKSRGYDDPAAVLRDIKPRERRGRDGK